MEALKIVLSCKVCAFRLPYTMCGHLLTFPMPPLSTVYGLICSTVGECVDPKGLRIAYSFEYKAKSDNLEYFYPIEAKKSNFEVGGVTYPKNVECNICPIKREFLYDVNMVLYINRTEYLPFFKSPKYSVVLGRSEDLAEYVSVEVVTLDEGTKAYFSNTLLDYSFRELSPLGKVCMMPRFINYDDGRHVVDKEYIILQDYTIFAGMGKSLNDFGSINCIDNKYIVDRTRPHPHEDCCYGLSFHTLVDG